MVIKLITKYWHYSVLAALAVLFFAGSFFYIYLTEKNNFIKWGSPDETANYTFTKLYSEEGTLKIYEKYNLIVNDIIHPRSTQSEFGKIKPVSFLGIILIYGTLAKIFSFKIIPYLTPIFAGIGIVYFYFLIKKIFGKTNALMSAFLLAFFPVYIYYSSRSMFHNVLFTDLLVVGLYYAISAVDKKNNVLKNNIYSSLAGIFTGLAIITRTSEALWILPVFLVLWVFNIKKFGITKLVLFLSFLFLAIMPMFYWNQILYDSPLSGGYPEMNSALKNIAAESVQIISANSDNLGQETKSYLREVKNNLFYFGFQEFKSLESFNNYFVKMFPLLFWPAAFGVILFMFHATKWKKANWAYLISFAVLSLILVFYYGSWDFHDNPNPASITIGNSYTRYWLPIYLGAIPFAGLFIIKITKILKNKYIIFFSRALIILYISFSSINFVLAGSEEGLTYSLEKNNQDRIQYNEVMKLTEDNSVIITYYHDKLFFPERKVIVGLFDDNFMIYEYAILADYLPIYYYNFTLPANDLEYLNNRRLKDFGLMMKKVEEINEDFTLYKLTKAVENL